MASRIRIRAQLKGDECEVKALMRHPMETGLRKDQLGDPIPARFHRGGHREPQWQHRTGGFLGRRGIRQPLLGMRFQGGRRRYGQGQLA